jgi:hypothetical protein
MAVNIKIVAFLNVTLYKILEDFPASSLNNKISSKHPV